MSHYHNNRISSASDSHSTELSGLKHRKIISGDYESAWSPTSPLDFRMLTTFANPFGGRVGGPSSSSKSIRKRQKKSWDSEKVGLGIVDSLDDVDSSRIVLPSTESKNIIFGSSLMRSGNPKCLKPHHLPNPMLEHFPSLSNPFARTPMFKVVDVVELGTSSSNNNNASQVMKPTESEMEISEDYTCVTTHGSNPKITHFYGDRVVESVERKEVKKDCCHGKKKESIFEIAPLPLTPDELLPPPSDFLSFCCFCGKKLALGKNIYMYRGFRAFCSDECRLEVIIMDEIMMEEEEEDEEEEIANGVVSTVG